MVTLRRLASSFSAVASRRAVASCSKLGSTASNSRRPVGVSATPLAVRSSSRLPSSRSSFMTCRLMVGWLTAAASAPREKLPACATSTKWCSAVKSALRNSLRSMDRPLQTH